MRAHSTLPFDMFDAAYSDAEARRARRMESIYHAGQVKIWNGREVLAALIQKHGKPSLADDKRHALARLFAIILWGELAAWKISAQLADQLVPLEAKLAAASQVHDEARHFYVMHDYLETLGERPDPPEYWSRRVLRKTLATDDTLKKLVGMQLTVETIALTIFQLVRESEVEPVLTELLRYYERDEARHVGLGVQLVPQMLRELSVPRLFDLMAFQLDLLFSALMSVRTIAPDLLTLGIDPRMLIGLTFRKELDVDALIRAEFPMWPTEPPVRRIYGAMTEVLFPSEGEDTHVSAFARLKHAFEVAMLKRTSVPRQWASRRSHPSNGLGDETAQSEAAGLVS